VCHTLMDECGKPKTGLHSLLLRYTVQYTNISYGKTAMCSSQEITITLPVLLASIAQMENLINM
jgi:hypothetical protein